MSTFQPTQPFRFLDLPGEIRNSIYDLLLCSWNDEAEEDSLLYSTLIRRTPKFQATPLLRTNKQIQQEASDYMVKRNQFVHISCRGMDVRNLFLTEGVPVISTDSRKVSQFTGYAMHMTLSKPVFGPSSSMFSEFDIMMLRSDLPQFCNRIDIESVMAGMNSTASQHTSIHAEVKLAYGPSYFQTTKIQEHLLEPIAASIRGVPNMSIIGPVDPALVESVTIEVAKPRWTDPTETLEEIGTGVDVGKRYWQQSSFYNAADSWAYAMRTLERMRHSSSWIGLQQTGGEDFVNKTADLYFTLHLLHAQFLQVDMSSQHASNATVQRNGRFAIQHLAKCETTAARFTQHVGSTWIPSNLQSAKMMFRHAKCIRLMRDTANITKAVTLVEQAATLAPNELMIRDEKDAVLSWNEEHEEAQRVIAEQETSSEGSSILSSIWNVVTALSA